MCGMCGRGWYWAETHRLMAEPYSLCVEFKLVTAQPVPV